MNMRVPNGCEIFNGINGHSLSGPTVMDLRTVREFDVLCLPSVKNRTAAQMKRLRGREGPGRSGGSLD